MSTLTSPLTAARACFDPAPDTIYLDAATYGLPPQPTVAALEHALRTWQDGTAAWAGDWEPAGDRSRAPPRALASPAAALRPVSQRARQNPPQPLGPA